MMICNFKNYMLLILFTLIDYTHGMHEKPVSVTFLVRLGNQNSRKCAFPIAVMLCSKLVHEH